MGKKKKKSPQATVTDIEEIIKKQVDKTGEKLTEEEKKDQFEALKKVYVEGKTPLEALEIPDEFTKLLYKQAYDQYNLGLYQDANHVFRVLCLLDPYAARYHMGLAATNHQMGNFKEAIPIYFAAYYLDISSPAPLFYISDCFMKANEPECAHFMLELAADVCAERNEYSRLKTRCYQMMKQIREDFGNPKEGVAEEEKEESGDIFSEMQTQAEEEL